MKTILFLLAFWSVSIFPQSPNDPRLLFKDFTQGTVYFKDDTQVKTLLNYDTFEEQMIFKDNMKVMALANPESIDRVKIEGKEFYWFENDIFLEKIDSTSITLYKRNRRQMQSKGKETSYGGISQTQSVATMNSLARGYDRQSSDLKAKEDFQFKNDDIFYLYSEGKFRSITTLKKVSKFFDIDKKEMVDYLEKNPVDWQNESDIIQLLEYCKTKNN